MAEHETLRDAVHLCIDMQTVYAADTPWRAPWFARVLPCVAALVEADPARTIFTRFMPPREPAQRPGRWRHYFERWRELTLAQADPALFALVPALARHCPPAQVIDKPAYSPFHGTPLAAQLQARGAGTVIVSGTETDVCVLAAVLDAVDLGFHVIVVEDAICSSADATHDAIVGFFRSRLSEQVEVSDTASVLAHGF